ncbi:MAG TPA: hypothetical protein VF766_03285, partial [Pyrinomonadaceae bacterium]
MFTRNRSKHLIILAATTLAFLGIWPALNSAQAQAVPGFCSAPYKINWPSANPVWSLCWTPPPSSSGVDGSGLELTHVFYKGRR